MKGFLKIFLCSLSFVVVSVPVLSQTLEEQQSRKARLEREIAILDRQIKDNAAQSSSAAAPLP